ncbi:MAG TPA: hypothetical protein VF365_06305 [Candidatus Limnocylindria bacterium]
MPKAKKAAADAAADPDRLIRQAAGTYRSADERFEVRGGSATGWFLVDTAQTNDFGQELILGPFGTLEAVREAIPPARSSKVTPIRPKAAPSSRRRAKAAPPPPPPPTWIDKLPKAEAASVRRLIAQLQEAGISDAEDLVRRDREGIGPAVATRLIERRLEAIVAELPQRGRDQVRELLRRAAEAMTVEGRGSADLPGWALVEIGPEPEPPNRRITIRELRGP